MHMRAKIRLPLPAILGLLILTPIGCGEDGRRPPTSYADENPPARVTDLRFLGFRDSSAVIAWTAPGDDGVVGAAARYDIRLGTAPLTPPTWAGAIQVPPPTPRYAGTVETLRVALRPLDSDLWIALNAVDDEGNWSGISNVVRLQPEELHWWGGFSAAAIGCSEIDAILVHDGALFAGGVSRLEEDPQGPWEALARWNGTTWDAVGEIPLTVVRAMTVYEGELIAGGWDFHFAEPDSPSVARWDGSAWHTLEGGMAGRVYALTVYRDQLIAAGSIEAAGDSTTWDIVAWDGRTWRPLGAGHDGVVYALAVHQDRLIAGGAFTRAGGREARGVASWDGTSWRPLGAGIEGFSVRALAVSGGTLFAGGLPDRYMEQFSPVASWDGIAWTRLPHAENSEVAAMVDFKGDLIIGGYRHWIGNAMRWDGSSWRSLGYIHGAVRAFAVDGSRLYVGGDFDRAGPWSAPLIARWDD
jgi:hypothetical protein